MIRSLAYSKGKPVVMLGLEAMNIERLSNGHPIRVNLRHLDRDGPPTDLPDIDVIVFLAGPEEIKMLMELATKKPNND